MPFLPDDIQLDHEQAATPSGGMTNDQFNAELRHRALAGASSKALNDFAAESGRKLAAGVDENVESAKHGGPVSVVTIGDKPAAGEPAPKAVGGTFLPDDIQLDEPAPAKPNVGAGLIDNDPLLKGAPPPPEAPPAEASGLAGKAWRDTVGENWGIDASNEETARKWSGPGGMLYPLVDAGAKVTEGIGGGVNAAIAGATQLVGNLAGANPHSTEDAARGLVDMSNIGQLYAGGHSLTPGYKPSGGVAAKVAPYVEPTEGRLVYDAADRLGIADSLLPADVGGPFTRRVTAGIVQTPLGAGPIVKASQGATHAVRGAAERTAAKAGAILEPEDAGDLVHKGVKAYAKNTARRGGRLYDRAEALAGDGKVDPAMSRTAAHLNIAELAETPETNAAAIKIMTSLATDLSKPLTINALRRLRTNTRAAIMKEGLRGTDVERRVGDVLDNASADIVAGIPKEAAAAYKTADAFWKERVAQIDEILAPIVGKKGEKGSTQAFEAIERLARRGDSKKLSRLMSSLSEEDAGAITATLIHRIGEATPGAQDALGGAFSPSTFLTNWNKLSDKAKTVLFNPELRSSLDDLATVTGGMKQASKYGNVSQTGGVIGTLATGAIAANAFTSPIRTVMALGAQYLTGRLMASPAFVRHLAKIGKAKSAGVLRTRVKELGSLAKGDIRGDVIKFQTALNSALASRGTGAAAAANDMVGVSAAASSGDAKEDQPE